MSSFVFDLLVLALSCQSIVIASPAHGKHHTLVRTEKGKRQQAHQDSAKHHKLVRTEKGKRQQAHQDSAKHHKLVRTEKGKRQQAHQDSATVHVELGSSGQLIRSAKASRKHAQFQTIGAHDLASASDSASIGARQPQQDSAPDCKVGDVVTEACTCGMENYEARTCEVGKVCEIASVDSHGYVGTACSAPTATAPAPAPAAPAAPTEACIGGWKVGDGTGGKEVKVGTVTSEAECIALVKEKCVGANGATMKNSDAGGCYCEFGMSGQNDSDSWKSCHFPASPVCVGGWKKGDGTGGTEEKVSDSVTTEQECKTLVKDRCPNANGMTVESSKEGQKCYCETGMTGQNDSTNWISCTFA